LSAAKENGSQKTAAENKEKIFFLISVIIFILFLLVSHFKFLEAYDKKEKSLTYFLYTVSTRGETLIVIIIALVIPTAPTVRGSVMH
jgi:hypothetical protein